MAPTLLHQSDSPTCALKLVGRLSPLSRWTGRPVVDRLRFTLTLDDPQRGKTLTLDGDRDQFATFATAVSDRVQSLLGPEGTLDPSHRHAIALGELSTSETGSILNLSAVQLFDLANAIDACHAELDVIHLASPRRRMPWVAAAASVAVAVGVGWLWRSGTLQPTAIAPEETAGEAIDPLPPVQAPENDLDVEREFSEPLADLDELPAPADAPDSDPPPVPAADAPELVAPPAPETDSSLGEAAPFIEPPTSTPSAPPELPEVPELAELPEVTANSDRVASAPNEAAIAPEAPAAEAPARPPARAAAPEPDAPADAPTATAPAPPESRPQTDASADRARPPRAFSAAVPEPTRDRTAQATAAHAYFQDRWQPPAELTRTLEYRLILSGDGRLERAIPIGSDAITNLDAANLPAPGTAIAPPAPDPAPTTLRLVLEPDGNVRTFWERPQQ